MVGPDLEAVTFIAVFFELRIDFDGLAQGVGEDHKSARKAGGNQDDCQGGFNRRRAAVRAAGPLQEFCEFITVIRHSIHSWYQSELPDLI